MQGNATHALSEILIDCLQEWAGEAMDTASACITFLEIQGPT